MKIIAVLLAIAVSTAAGAFTCTPRLKFNVDCNTCICTGDGTEAMCTYMSCDAFKTGDVLRDIRVEETEPMCEPGKTFKLNDRTECHCSEDGGLEAACSSMTADEFYSAKTYDVKNHQYCEGGSVFSPDNCNTCKCSKDGTRAMCTLKLCPENGLLAKINAVATMKKTQVCKPRERFMDYCNYCVCSMDGANYACTRMYCDPELWNKDGSMKVKEEEESEENTIEEEPKLVCQPRTPFMNYCNYCFCSSEGTEYACTKMLCDHNVWNKNGTKKVTEIETRVFEEEMKICEPRKSFKSYCNTCFCNDDGTNYACTKMLCDEDVWNADGSMKVAMKKSLEKADEPALTKICEPHSEFKEYCNSCLCSADGYQKVCTLMRCDPEIFNEDGSLKIH